MHLRKINGNGRNGTPPPAIPAWYIEWRKKYGRYVELRCGCIQDIDLPECISTLSRKPQILCDKHLAFFGIKRNVKFSEIVAERTGILIPDEPDSDIPPY